MGALTWYAAQADEEGAYLGASALKADDLMPITRGLFTEFIATVDSLSPQQRTWILPAFRGSKFGADIPGNDLQVRL